MGSSIIFSMLITVSLKFCISYYYRNTSKKIMVDKASSNIIFSRSRKQYPTKQQLYGHLPLISWTIKVKQWRYVRYCRRNKNKLISNILQSTPVIGCLVNWSCWIHWLLFCRGARPSRQWVCWIWHKTIWWWGSSNAGTLGNTEYPFIIIAPRTIMVWSDSTW